MEVIDGLDERAGHTGKTIWDDEVSLELVLEFVLLTALVLVLSRSGSVGARRQEPSLLLEGLSFWWHSEEATSKDFLQLRTLKTSQNR